MSRPQSNEPKLGVNYDVTGRLNRQTLRRQGRVLEYSEPADSATCTTGWILGQMLNGETKNIVHCDDLSFVMLGKDRDACQAPDDHPSVSKQHAVIQFRRRMLGTEEVVIPYLIDLESTNGTTLNGEAITPGRYIQIHNEDAVRLGKSDGFVLALLS